MAAISYSQDATEYAVEHVTISRQNGRTLQFPRMINGLWQLAGGHDKNIEVTEAAKHMEPLIEHGLNCFDMADHYGDAELVIGQHAATSKTNAISFTKWCPDQTGGKSFEQAEAAVNLALQRMKQDKIKLLQYHAWDYTDDTYLHNLSHLQTMCAQGKIEHLGLTNVDAAHLELLLDSGFDIATNQVSCSILDRRAELGALSRVCTARGVGILAYGTLLGGFVSEKWLGQPEPETTSTSSSSFSNSAAPLNWGLRKYLRFIRAAGGWAAFQRVLGAVAGVARKHNVGVAAVATRYVLDVPGVSAVIVGTRLAPGSRAYIRRNLAAFALRLDADDRAAIAEAQSALAPVPGDCGDEYRRPPFLTAAGDLSHHLKADDGRLAEVAAAVAAGKRVEFSSGGKWEGIAGYCRAIRTGNYIRVSGTTAASSVESIPVVGGSSAGSQTVAVLDIIERALKALGSSLADVVRTRIMVRSEADCGAVSLAHGWAFKSRGGGVRPANTLIISGLVGDEFLVEIEAEAEVGCSSAGVMST